MTLYLIDANVLITANNSYYPRDRIPQFWDWLSDKASQGLVKMSWEIYEEIEKGKGPVKNWLVQEHVREALILEEDVNADSFNKVLNKGYGENLTDVEL